MAESDKVELSLDEIRAIFTHDSDSEEEFEGFVLEEVTGEDNDDDLAAVEEELNDVWAVDPGCNVTSWCREFDLEVGRKSILVDTSPVDYFKLFFDDTLFELISSETNRYAEQTIRENQLLKPSSRLREWVPVKVSDIMAVTGLQIGMGLSKYPDIARHWSTHPLFYNTFFGNIMSRNKFQLITSMLHFNDNDYRVPRGEDGYDPIYKIHPVYNHLNQKFVSVYQPHRELTIDESMFGFKGRISFRQYMPAKRTRFGIKNWVLNESTSGYALKILPYTGKSNNTEGSLATRVVLELLDGYEGKGHHVYMDNFYCSPELFKTLQARDIGACGTVRSNRKGMPPSFKTSKIKAGDAPVFFRKDKVVATQFHDKKPVQGLSSIHLAENVVKYVRCKKSASGERAFLKPKLIDDYNKYMGGTDRMDQLCSYYQYPHRTPKWYMNVYHHLKEISLVNAKIIYESDGNPPLDTVAFRLSVMDGLLSGYKTSEDSARPNPATFDEFRLSGRHFLESAGSSRPDCIVCSDRKLSVTLSVKHAMLACMQYSVLKDIIH